MDDLSQQLNQILSDPQSMKQIQNMMGALGLGSQTSTPQTDMPQPAPPQAPPAPAQSQPMENPLGGISPEMLQMVSRMAPLMNQVNREDDSTRLLRALRPLLSPARQQKLDEAIKILHIMRLLPLLKDSGLFSGLISSLF